MRPIVMGSIRRHIWAVRTASRCTQWWRDMACPKAVRVSPRGVIRALNHEGIRPVLIGTYGLNGWREEPRGTQDVDVLVRRLEVSRSVMALSERYPTLKIERLPTVIRFVDSATKHGVLDLHKPVYPLSGRLFRTAIKIGETHDIATLEMTIVSKLNLMSSPERDVANRLQDMADLMSVIDYNRSILDMPQLHTLMKQGMSRRDLVLRSFVDDVLVDADVNYSKYVYRDLGRSK
jgi:hypothetical protein